MVAVKFLFLFLVVLCGSKASLMPKAILKLVQDNYGTHPVVIEVFFNSRKIKILDETLKLLSLAKHIKVTPINTDDIELKTIKRTVCFEQNELCHKEQVINSCKYFKDICIQEHNNDAIFLFDKLENYQKVKAKIETAMSYHDISRPLNHLVHCEDSTNLSLQKMLTSDSYESFLLKSNDEISLHTMTMFTKKQCRPEQLVEINQFSSMERKWKTEKFFRPRIENFNGCVLHIEISSVLNDIKMPFFNELDNKYDDSPTITEGSMIDMFEALSTHLNFTFIFGSYIDASRNPNLQPIDMTIGPLKFIESKYFDKSISSDPICSTSDVFVVPPGEYYTSWEKLLMPFDRPTWICLGIVFAAAFFVIFLLKLRKSSSVYEFVIGSNIETPGLNVVAILMGIGQMSLPKRNMSRFMFINFVIFCLIMRTAYQGKYFEFLTSDMRKKPIETIEELKDKNFTVIMEIFQFKFLEKLDILEG